jgi:mono/diheme cytochrome c family protein
MSFIQRIPTDSNHWLLRVGVSLALSMPLINVTHAQGLDGIAQEEDLATPVYDANALPPVGSEWHERNPYRSRPTSPAVITQGRIIFNQSCARCHGADADGSLAAPNLKLIGRACQPIPEPELKLRCQTDADVYFSRSVRYGKVRVGITHMPPWDKILTQEAIWALLSFVENAPPNKH